MGFNHVCEYRTEILKIPFKITIFFITLFTKVTLKINTI